jgi:hypothetical protein
MGLELGEVGRVPGHEVVDRDDRVAALEERVDDMRTDESCSSGN